MRQAIGLLGVALPVLLVVMDWLFVDSRRPIRGSMSAYYFSSSHDLFVGGLVATGIFLITYMSARRRTYDYVLSSAAGVLVLIVAFLPTGRAGTELGVRGFQPSGSSCEDHPGPPLCNGFQQVWGEDVVMMIHRLSAVLFVVLLAALCVVFALREFGYGPAAQALVGDYRNVGAVRAELERRGIGVLRYLWRGSSDGEPPRRRVLAYLAAAALIIISGLWAGVGPDLWLPGIDGPIGATYVGEFGAFVSFGLAWLVAAWDLMPRRLRSLGDAMASVVDAVSGAEPAAR